MMKMRSIHRRSLSLLINILLLVLVGGCANMHSPSEPESGAKLSPVTQFTRDLVALPPTKGKVPAAVYGFRDQTGQYKAAPDSSFSTAVTQGASSMLIKAMRDSGWFIPVERENLQNLLTERKIVRALEMPQSKDSPVIQIPQLLPAAIIIEGGVISYESNVRTGGIGARFLGIGISSQYRIDQVTVNLRSIDIRGGQILQSISTTKTIYSYQIQPTVFKYVNFKDLVEFELGVTRNEPAQMCVREAIEAALVHLIIQGVKDGNWQLKDSSDINAPIMQKYLKEAAESMSPSNNARFLIGKDSLNTESD